nr:DNA polymerase [Kribbella sandramycini]
MTHRVAGDEVPIFYPETDADLSGFRDFLDRNAGQVVAFDTETTGLHIYGAAFGVRLAQFGSCEEAWVIRVDRFAATIRETLAHPGRQWVAHNAPYDLLAVDRVGLAPFAELGPRMFDTYILAHLADPRMESEGGTGLGLKPLSAVYVDPEAEDTAKGLYAVFRSEYKATKETGWALIDIDHPLYIRYAGLDVIYTARLLRELGILIKGNGLSKLAHFEHRVQLITTSMQRRGMRVDVDYTRQLVAELAAEEQQYKAVAARFGVENVNSTRQVTAALQGMGEQWSTKTATGNLSVGKDVLLGMADLDHQWTRNNRRDPNLVADAVVRAKRASKWSTSYAQAFLDRRDDDDRIHPSIKSLAARTARMSVSDPPLQQLPSGDWKIRRGIIADEGMTIWSVDYSQVEMKVIAALSGDPNMLRAVASGEDLHTFTAKLVMGPRWATMTDTEKAKARKLFKGVGFGKVYGGGAAGLARQTGITYEEAKAATDAYDAAFPGIKAYGRRLQRQAQFGKFEVVTPFGRHLPLDRDRMYAATNYVVQSTARDLLAKALVDLDNQGLSDHLLLPVHDEILGQAPVADANEFAHEVRRVMESTFQGVAITADAEVYGSNWGMGYGAAA